mmetsp:Transcript_93766/g.205214  ORF Transcript_93766/g.205214 Transcript_93766/m.205214 type:complete len:227 (-) Transcript_93766:472-1152(-)
MIYICKGLCLPCKACDAACQGLFKGIEEFCAGISNIFGPITNNPLGGYVIGTWVVMAGVLFGSGYSLSQVDCDEPKVPCIANCGLALIHIAFAFYIQRRLVGALTKEPTTMTHNEIAAKAREVMMYDVGFCLYFFVFIGSFGYNCSVFDALSECEGTGPAWTAAAFMLLYGFGVWNYALCWYGCQCCCGTFESARSQAMGTQAKTQPQQGGVLMGAPAVQTVPARQ